MSVLVTYGGHGLVTSNGTGIGVPVDPYNPYNLPPKTIRYMFEDAAYDPTVSATVDNSIWTRVSANPNIWDWTTTASNPTLYRRFSNNAFGYPTTSLRVHILGANLQGFPQPGIQSTWQNNPNIVSVRVLDTRTITDFHFAFSGCTNLYEIAGLPIRDTAFRMYAGCTSLRRLPRFETDSGVNVQEMFIGCRNVESGILDCYDSLRNASRYFACFRDCGVDTPTGAAELAQIPSDWK